MYACGPSVRRAQDREISGPVDGRVARAIGGGRRAGSTVLAMEKRSNAASARAGWDGRRWWPDGEVDADNNDDSGADDDEACFRALRHQERKVRCGCYTILNMYDAVFRWPRRWPEGERERKSAARRGRAMSEAHEFEFTEDDSGLGQSAISNTPLLSLLLLSLWTVVGPAKHTHI